MAKRKKGELPSGSIRRKVYNGKKQKVTKDGVPVFDADGKPVMISDYISITAETAAEANRMVAEIKAGKRKGRPEDMTLYEAIDRYINDLDAVLSPSTIRGYRKEQRNAFPSIMQRKLKSLDVQILQEAVNQECKRFVGKNTQKTLSAKTVINRWRLVTAALNNYAPNIDHSAIKLPQIEHNQHELSTPDIIFNMVKDTEMELPVMLAMWLSFTASEILGLTKSKSISSDGNFITIKDVIIMDENNNEVIKHKGKQPTRDRTLRIPEYIKGLIDKVETDRLVNMSGPALSKRFARMVKKAGIPHMTFHDLRHVNASVMTILQVPDKYAQERGGWKTDTIMKSRYMQTFSREREAVDVRIDNYMQDMLFADTADRLRAEKYRSWLTLFDRTDSPDAVMDFELFCKKNHINL